MNTTSRLVVSHAALLGIGGVILLFLPKLLLHNDGDSSSETLMLTQILAASCLAFAAGNWTARSAILGGIYGRAIVVGNQAFWFITSVVLAKNVPVDATPLFWYIMVASISGAILYSILMFKPGWIK